MAPVAPPWRVGLDVDGVLADFTRSFLALCGELSGRPAPADYVQRSWSDWWEYRRSETDAAWEHIHRDPFFWQRLRALHCEDLSVNAFLAALWSNPRLDVTFITTRPGATARRQTITWLTKHGMWNPQVLIAKNNDDKGKLAAMLELDAYVDDYWVNCNAVLQHRPSCHVTLYGQPWNEGIGGVGDAPLPRVVGLHELWSLIEQRARLPSFTGSSTAGVAPISGSDSQAR